MTVTRPVRYSRRETNNGTVIPAAAATPFAGFFALFLGSEAHMVTTADPVNLLLWVLVLTVIIGLIVFAARRLF